MTQGCDLAILAINASVAALWVNVTTLLVIGSGAFRFSTVHRSGLDRPPATLSLRNVEMDRRGFLFRAMHGMLAGGGALSLTGCGTLLHKDRINRPHSRDVDWKVVALNGLGLCFFFVPGVIAFVVDFYTGAIYLPHESCGDGVPMGEPMPVYESMPTPTAEPGPQASIERVGDTTFKRIALSKQLLSREEIEQQVTRSLGRPVTLDGSDVRMSQLKGLEEYASVERQHRRDPLFGAPPLRVFGQGSAA